MIEYEAMRHAPDALMALHAGDHQSNATVDNEWGEMFEALGDLPSVMLVAPAAGNHEYWEEFEDTPQERRVLSGHWRAGFALPRNGAGGAHTRDTTYWFDVQGVRVAVLDGTSALDLGSAGTGRQVTVQETHNYLILGPVISLVSGGPFGAVTLTGRSTMRCEIGC